MPIFHPWSFKVGGDSNGACYGIGTTFTDRFGHFYDPVFWKPNVVICKKKDITRRLFQSSVQRMRFTLPGFSY